jgi:hypothetical protein
MDTGSNEANWLEILKDFQAIGEEVPQRGQSIVSCFFLVRDFAGDTSPAASSFTPDLLPLPSPGSGVKGAGKRWEEGERIKAKGQRMKGMGKGRREDGSGSTNGIFVLFVSLV